LHPKKSRITSFVMDYHFGNPAVCFDGVTGLEITQIEKFILVREG
jgi:hypothetical protein